MATNLKPLPPEAAECPQPVTYEPRIEKAEEQAMLLTLMNQWAFQLDDEYLLEAAKQTRQQADRYDSAAVLNRSWNEHHSKVLSAKADALEHIARYIQANKRVSELQKKEDEHSQAADVLAKLFY